MGLLSVTTPSQLNNERIVDDLLTSIIKGNAVLVLGHEGILSEKYGGGNVKEYMVESFFKFKKKANPNFGSSYNNFDDFVYEGGADLSKLKEDISNLVQNHYDFDNEEEYSPLLFRLLKRCYFRMVLTTTYDHYVEHMLRKAWANKHNKGLRVLNIYDIRNQDIDTFESGCNDIQPTLYYIFGKADAGKDFVVTENDAMKVTKKWMDEAEAPKELIKFLKDKTILALGTKFDDWLFRFFWFTLHRDDKALRKGRVAISLSEYSESERKLMNYLKNQHIENLDYIEIVNFILDSYERAEEDFMRNNARGSDVFISYCSKSYESVKHLFYAMYENLNNRNQKVRIWFDRNNYDDKDGLKPGADFNKDITNAINKCKIFIPVICKSVVEVLESKASSSKSYFLREWEIALSRLSLQNTQHPIHIIPICVDGIDISKIKPSTRKKSIFELVRQETVGSSKTPYDFKKFLAEIEKLMNEQRY